jgi:ribonuclease HII
MNGLVAGVDEAGRGPLAGPVVVAAVILDPKRSIEGLDDSKKLNAKRRDALFSEICSRALAWSVISVTPEEIDRLNILRATLHGMTQAIEALDPRPALALIDGNRCPETFCETRSMVGGDGLEPAISAASIVAKVTRDRLMLELHQRYPEYGFDRNKGYPTGEHMRRLAAIGPCEAHRRSFAPVRKSIQRELGI